MYKPIILISMAKNTPKYFKKVTVSYLSMYVYLHISTLYRDSMVNKDIIFISVFLCTEMSGNVKICPNLIKPHKTLAQFQGGLGFMRLDSKGHKTNYYLLL